MASVDRAPLITAMEEMYANAVIGDYHDDKDIWSVTSKSSFVIKTDRAHLNQLHCDNLQDLRQRIGLAGKDLLEEAR